MKLPRWVKRKPEPVPPLHPQLPPATGPLREFVYLDEVSVISLVASRRGTVPEAVTRSESARDTAELSSKIAANAAIAKAEVGSKLATESTKGVTTVAKSVVQTTFKDLRELEDDRLTLKVPLEGDPPNVDKPDDLVRLATSEKCAGWVVSSGKLRRGEPVEVEVELQADPLFRIGTAISEGIVLIGEMGDHSGVSRQDMIDMQRVTQMLERLLAGLVPVRARLVDYRVVDVHGSELIVHRRLLDGLDVQSRDLTMVAVASRDLFWKDLRRVLFTGARYTVFCRMGRSGVQRKWNPVKLAEALSEIAPHLQDQLEQFVGQFRQAVRSGGAGELVSGSRESMMRNALITFAGHLAERGGATVTAADLSSAGLLSDEQLARHTGVENQRESFAAVRDHLAELVGADLTPDEIKDLRWNALRKAGLTPDSHVATEPQHANRPDEWLLEVEPVAIYW